MEAGDAEAIFEIKGNPKVTECYAAGPHATRDKTRKWVEDRQTGYRERKSIWWMYTLKGQTRVVGCCCYWNIDEESRCAEIGYELNRAYWHQGISSEALVPILEYGFDGMDLNRIETCPFAENASSNRLLQNLEFKLEGTLRQRFQFRGRFLNQRYYGFQGEFNRPRAVSP